MKTAQCLSLAIVLVIMLSLTTFQCSESFSPVTGYSYQDGCAAIPVPENIRHASRSGPFYDLNAVRPAMCAYRNFTFPPPLGYKPVLESPPELYDVYQYWWNDAVLSHPQTAYLV